MALNTPAAQHIARAAERLAAAGSLARATRHLAYWFAREDLAADESVPSYPAPVLAPSGPALACLLFPVRFDPARGEHLLFRPRLEVTVAAASVTVVGHRLWHAGLEPEAQASLAPYYPERVRRLAAGRRQACEAELYRLHDAAAARFWNDEPAGEPDRRLVELLEFLTPPAVGQFCWQLNPEFFRWLTDWSGAAEIERPALLDDGWPSPAPPEWAADPWESPQPSEDWRTETEPFPE